MMNMWAGCPLQAKFKYIDHLPTKKSSSMTFGICTHEALKFYNETGNLERSIEKFHEYWDDPSLLGAEIEIWNKRTNHGSFAKLGPEMLRLYDEKLQYEERVVVGQEHPFLVPMGKHEISGVVDLIEVRKSGRGKDVLRLVDYKTASRKPYADNLKLNTQFTFYIYASMQPEFWFGNPKDPAKYPPICLDEEQLEGLWQRYNPRFPRRGIWLHLRDGKELDAGGRDDEDFMRLYRSICEIARAIEHEVYVPCISGDTCIWCDFVEPCGVRIPDPTVRDPDAF